MRLISSWKDYYDSVQGLGIDLSKVYLRETKERKDISFTIAKRGWGAQNNNIGDLPGVSANKTIIIPGLKQYDCPSHSLEQVYILFSGKLYGGIHLYKIHVNGWNDTTKHTIKYLWNKEALDIAIEE